MEERGNTDPQGESPFTDQPLRRRGTDPYGQPAQYAPTPPKKKTSKFGIGCLGVFVLIVAVIVGMAIGGKNTPTDAATTPPAAPAGTGAAVAPAATTPPPAVTTVVLHQSGNGIIGTKQFTVGDNWSLSYTFNCADFGQAGNFQVTEDYPDGNILVNSLATSGSDTTYQNNDAGTHSLEVNSECNWTITVTDGG